MAVTSALDSTSPKSATVPCPAGTRALGGGASLLGAGGGSPASNVAVQRSEPTVDGAGNPNGWIAFGAEVQPTPTTWTVTAVALCAVVS